MISYTPKGHDWLPMGVDPALLGAVTQHLVVFAPNLRVILL